MLLFQTRNAISVTAQQLGNLPTPPPSPLGAPALWMLQKEAAVHQVSRREIQVPNGFPLPFLTQGGCGLENDAVSILEQGRARSVLPSSAAAVDCAQAQGLARRAQHSQRGAQQRGHSLHRLTFLWRGHLPRLTTKVTTSRTWELPSALLQPAWASERSGWEPVAGLSSPAPVPVENPHERALPRRGELLNLARR